MKLAKTDVIAGLPAPTARDLARRLRLTTRQVDIEAFVPGRASALHRLHAEGYLRVDELRSSPTTPGGSPASLGTRSRRPASAGGTSVRTYTSRVRQGAVADTYTQRRSTRYRNRSRIQVGSPSIN